MVSRRQFVRIVCGALLLAHCLPNRAAAESLEEAWSAALAVDQRLEASRWKRSAAQRGLCAAKAERLPSITASTGYLVLDNPLAFNLELPAVPGVLPDGASGTFNLTQDEMLLVGVHVTQPLTFGHIQHGIDAARATVTGAFSDEARTELDIKMQVAEAYINVLKAQRALEVAEDKVKSLDAHLRHARNLLNEGAAVKNDYLASEVTLANARQDRLQADSLLRLAKAVYNRALQRPLDFPVTLEGLPQPDGEYDIEHLTQLSLQQRPEIAWVNAKVRSMQSQACKVRAAGRPQIGLRGGLDYVENRFLDNEAINSVGVFGEWNFFDAGRKRHRAAQLEHSAEALLRMRSDLEWSIVLQVRQAWLNLNTLRQRVEVNRKAIKSADENLKVASTRYREGAGTNTEVLDAQTLRSLAYNNYYGSLYDSILAEMRLKRAVGSFTLDRSGI
jgi:outer membrane protein TolC